MPGGSWWSLCEREDDQVVAAKPLTVVFALRRLWGLLGDDKWIMYAAFGAVIISAVSSLLLIEQQWILYKIKLVLSLCINVFYTTIVHFFFHSLQILF